MFAKLVVIVLVVAVMALALLVERQKRYETMLEISRTHAAVIEQEREIWRLRAEVARRVRPDEVRLALRSVSGEWEPLPHRLDQPRPPTAPRLAVDAPREGGVTRGELVRYGG